jgi:hypothetical protein
MFKILLYICLILNFNVINNIKYQEQSINEKFITNCKNGNYEIAKIIYDNNYLINSVIEQCFINSCLTDNINITIWIYFTQIHKSYALKIQKLNYFWKYCSFNENNKIKIIHNSHMIDIITNL